MKTKIIVITTCLLLIAGGIYWGREYFKKEPNNLDIVEDIDIKKIPYRVEIASESNKVNIHDIEVVTINKATKSNAIKKTKSHVKDSKLEELMFEISQYTKE